MVPFQLTNTALTAMVRSWWLPSARAPVLVTFHNITG